MGFEPRGYDLSLEAGIEPQKGGDVRTEEKFPLCVKAAAQKGVYAKFVKNNTFLEYDLYLKFISRKKR